MFTIDAGTIGAFIPIVAFAIPIVAIVGGIATKIAKTMARARIEEQLIQERIKCIERGITPPPIAPGLATAGFDPDEDAPRIQDPNLYHQNRVFGLRLGGAITMAVAMAVGFGLAYSEHDTAWVWMTIPAAVGMCLIIASFFVPGRPATGPRP
ncbi:MAG: hypothetical protein HZB25_09340 [Candidatus Eisenbacteria bacterium]|nr:hypothetical protein [Candidatus Eisenbacteria bacterium]